MITVTLCLQQGIGGTGIGFDGPSAGRLGAHGFIPQHNPPPEKLKSVVTKVRACAASPEGICRLNAAFCVLAVHAAIVGARKLAACGKFNVLGPQRVLKSAHVSLAFLLAVMHSTTHTCTQNLLFSPVFDAHRQQRSVQRSKSLCPAVPASWGADPLLHPPCRPPKLQLLRPCAGGCGALLAAPQLCQERWLCMWCAAAQHAVLPRGRVL